MTTFTTTYTEDGTYYTVTHEGSGPLFARGAVQWSDDCTTAELHYGDPLLEAENCLRDHISTGTIPKIFEHSYYLLVRTGASPNVHYFPVPLMMVQVVAGTAPRWMRKRYTQIKKHLGIA